MKAYYKDSKGNKKWVAIISLLAVNLVVTAFILFYLFIPNGDNHNGILGFETARNGQYTLYIGTNDKDTYEQKIPTEKAVEIVNGICAKYAEGWTMNYAEGGWVDENDILTQENTLVYTFAYTEEEVILSIMDEVLTALNQNAILVERRDFSSVFYGGGSLEND